MKLYFDSSGLGHLMPDALGRETGERRERESLLSGVENFHLMPQKTL